jgi:hypothetical protein
MTMISDEAMPTCEPCICSCHDDEPWGWSRGETICLACLKPYRDHPKGGPVGEDGDGERFLLRLCSGWLVKL